MERRNIEDADRLDLVQTGVCSIIYGWYNKEYQELFRCPRELDDKDLKSYINDNRCILGFDNDETEELAKVPGKELIGYFRVYFRGGWHGRWFLNTGCMPCEKDYVAIRRILDHMTLNFPHGCSWDMREYMAAKYKKWGDEERYLIRPFMSDYYKIMVDTKYGNGDYPLRIYVYR